MSTQLDELKAESLAKWRSWAETMSEGGAFPAPLELLEVAAILEIRDPGVAIEVDAAAIREAANSKEPTR
jgi:hypothetical protein